MVHSEPSREESETSLSAMINSCNLLPNCWLGDKHIEEKVARLMSRVDGLHMTAVRHSRK